MLDLTTLITLCGIVLLSATLFTIFYASFESVEDTLYWEEKTLICAVITLVILIVLSVVCVLILLILKPVMTYWPSILIIIGTGCVPFAIWKGLKLKSHRLKTRTKSTPKVRQPNPPHPDKIPPDGLF